MPGPGKKPLNLKIVGGTNRADRISVTVDLPPLESAPPAPDWLPNIHAVKEWERLAGFLVANRLLTAGGISALGVLCALHGKVVQLYSAGESPTGHMLAQYRALTNDFGLTPVAQGKVKPSGNSQEGNKFARNGRPVAA